MERISGFEPILGENPKVLILGSMPSVKSLENNEYYGHGRNQFWRIMGDLFGFDRHDPYDHRRQVIISKGIAVWDVLESCERKGSLDKDIREAAYNDIPGLLKRYPTISHVVLNGGKARDVFKKHFSDYREGIEIHAFYSTSPANAMAFEKKMNQWKAIDTWLESDG